MPCEMRWPSSLCALLVALACSDDTGKSDTREPPPEPQLTRTGRPDLVHRGRSVLASDELPACVESPHEGLVATASLSCLNVEHDALAQQLEKRWGRPRSRRGHRCWIDESRGRQIVLSQKSISVVAVAAESVVLDRAIELLSANQGEVRALPGVLGTMPARAERGLDGVELRLEIRCAEPNFHDAIAERSEHRISVSPSQTRQILTISEQH